LPDDRRNQFNRQRQTAGAGVLTTPGANASGSPGEKTASRKR